MPRRSSGCRRAGLVYPCFCTRADIAAVADRAARRRRRRPIPAPAAACPTIPSAARRRRTAGGSTAAKALAIAGLPSWTRGGRQPLHRRAESDIGDVILARKDAPASYHLACVVDDAASGVTLVVRGADLRPSTPIQRLLQALLGLPEPAYLHHPLVAHDDGRRLAKRDLAPTLAAMRDGGRRRADARRRPAARASCPLGFAFGEA